MSWPLEYPGASPETWIDWYRRELAEMTEPIEKDPHPLLAENRQLRAEIERLRAALRGLLEGCCALNKDEAVLPRQMQQARRALEGK